MKISYETEIKASIEEVFSLISDAEKMKLWFEGLKETSYTSPYNQENLLGAKFNRKVVDEGVLTKYEGEIVAYEKPHHYMVHIKSKKIPVPIQIGYRLKTLSEGTHLEYTAELVKANWMVRKLVAKIDTTKMQNRLEQQMAQLKAVAESTQSQQEVEDSPLSDQKEHNNYRLTVHTPHKTWHVQLDTQERWTIGREIENDIVIDHQKVSRVHARIKRDGDKFMLQDLDSANGTWLGQHRIQTHILCSTDTVDIGHAQLIFESSITT